MKRKEEKGGRREKEGDGLGLLEAFSWDKGQKMPSSEKGHGMTASGKGGRGRRLIKKALPVVVW